MNEIQHSPRARRWRGYAVNVLLFVFAIVAIRAWQQRDMVSGSAPQLQGTTLAAYPYTLSAHPAHPVLVHFWATWCSICRTEQNSIAAIAHDEPEVITVAMQSGKPEDVMHYMQEQGTSFPVLNDADGRIASTWGVHAVPASFIIDRNGQIRFVEVGYTTEIGIRVRLWLAGMFG